MCFVRNSLSLLLVIIHLSHANWGTPGSSQYHIQTDEGPERYFRYQTDNGQFRKEKRLQDGTVIGTNAWIDGSGYLRQSDYIADKAGYRILKSKTVFVGKDRPIEEAMKEAKRTQAGSGLLAPSKQRPTSTRYVPPVIVTTPVPVTTTIQYSSPGYYYPKAPTVFVRPHSQPNDRYLPTPNNDLDQPGVSVPSNDISHIQPPSVIYLPPLEDTPKVKEHDLPPIALFPSSTPSPNRDESHLPPIALYPSSSQSPFDLNNVLPLASAPTPISVRQLSDGLLPPKEFSEVVPVSSRFQPRISSSTYRPYTFESSTEKPTQIDYNRNSIEQTSYRQSHDSRSSNVPLFDRSKYQQYSSYDGVGVTSNGFRYFLPRQYHEEETNNDGTRDGSYGYVDPFGIRRVVYYNAGQNGFVHRKNNRYVGFNSTPYDQRPT